MGAAPKANKKNVKNPEAANAIDPASQLHEIQKLLFGQQIAQLEEVITELRKDTQQHFASLEKKLSDKLEAQRKDFSAQLSDMAKHHTETSAQHDNRDALIEGDLDELRKALESFEAQTEAAHGELEAQLAQEAKQLADSIDSKVTNVTEHLNKSSHALDDQKVDRNNLAELLSSIANKLQSEA